MKIYLDGTNLHSRDDFYKKISEELRTQITISIGEDADVTNLDGLYDVLTDICDEVEIQITNKEELLMDEEGYYGRFMRMLRAVENQNDKICHEII